MGKNAHDMPIFVIHGTSDPTVNIINGQQIIKQWARTLDKVVGHGQAAGVISDVPTSTQKGQVSSGRSFNLKNYVNPKSGKIQMKFLEVDQMAHAWSGGSSSGTYTDPKGPDASQMMIEYFTSYGSSGNGTTTTTTTTTTTATTNTLPATTDIIWTDKVRLKSIPSESGWVGMTILDGYSTDEAKIGSKDGFVNDAYRVILSFDLSLIPIGRNVTQVVFRYYRKSMTGKVNQLSIDFKEGSFNSDRNLKQSDYYASATVSKIAMVETPLEDKGFAEVELPAVAVKLVGNRSATRVALRLKDPSLTPSANANTIYIYGGEAEATAPQYAPALIVKLE